MFCYFLSLPLITSHSMRVFLLSRASFNLQWIVWTPCQSHSALNGGWLGKYSSQSQYSFARWPFNSHRTDWVGFSLTWQPRRRWRPIVVERTRKQSDCSVHHLNYWIPVPVTVAVKGSRNKDIGCVLWSDITLILFPWNWHCETVEECPLLLRGTVMTSQIYRPRAVRTCVAEVDWLARLITITCCSNYATVRCK